MKRLFWIVAMLLSGISSLTAQQTGNIVEIFGKEKVNSTGEGAILHTFTEALVLRDALIPVMLSGTQDILYWQIAVGCFERPKAGTKLNDSYEDERMLMWEKLLADSAGVFTGNLNHSYIYTEFESAEEKVVLLEATGHTRVYINGMPHEGDHYDYGYTLIPFRLHKGLNQFIYTYGRFARVSARLVIPEKQVQFSKRDLTVPSVIKGENDEKWGSVRVINASEENLRGLKITCKLETGEEITFATDSIMPMLVQKIKFRIPAVVSPHYNDSIMAKLILSESSGMIFDEMTIKLNFLDKSKHHERTFISRIDGSVQYYSVVPSLNDDPGQALVLSVHGASVEAISQARAYKQKSNAHIIAPTNRRPFGFNWEEWGRLDALEVLHEGRKLFGTDTSLTYLTGHSMGGHGTWFLGATYPDKWAAIAPCAGYPDITGYRRSGSDTTIFSLPHFEMISRGALAGRTLELLGNYQQFGVYILHGGADRVVPVEQARQMRLLLGGFHGNFSYYEYPDGSHWYGDHSMDWPPLFDFLNQNKIPSADEVKEIDFITASPAVSSSDYWVSINQQLVPYKHSRIHAMRTSDSLIITTENVRNLTLQLSEMNFDTVPVVVVNNQVIFATQANDLILNYDGLNWKGITELDKKEKNPERYGGFKLAFQNNVVFIYATNGSEEENQWYKNKARFDAETFLYRGNSSVDVIPDFEYIPDRFKGRNVIIYGNADNNLAWKYLLTDSPVQVSADRIVFGEQIFRGDDLGTFFIYPHPDNDKSAIGIVAGTGVKGMKAVFANDYFSGITGFPDLLVFSADWIKDGPEKIIVSGFFGHDWSIDKGDFVITSQ